MLEKQTGSSFVPALISRDSNIYHVSKDMSVQVSLCSCKHNDGVSIPVISLIPVMITFGIWDLKNVGERQQALNTSSPLTGIRKSSEQQWVKIGSHCIVYTVYCRYSLTSFLFC